MKKVLAFMFFLGIYLLACLHDVCRGKRRPDSDLTKDPFFD